MRFIEVTDRWKGTKAMLNLDRVAVVTEQPTSTCFVFHAGEESSGGLVFFSTEMFDEIKEKIYG